MNPTSTESVVDIILDEIEKEPYFSKKSLRPKLIGIIKGFRLALDSHNYNKIETPSNMAKMMRAEMKQAQTVIYLKRKLKEKHSDEEMTDIYKGLDSFLIERGF